jgi:hypothetical protein
MNIKDITQKKVRTMIDETTNHKTLYWQADQGHLLVTYKEGHDNMRSPTPQEYDALPPDIKANYPQYIDYKNTVDAGHLQTRNAMKAKLQQHKSQYISITGGNASHKAIFDTEVDELISDLGV